MKKRKIVKSAPPQSSRISITKSSLKYVYLVAFFALLSGFFHPLITETSFDGLIIGILVLLTGLVGGIMLYKAATSETAKTIYLGAGFGLLALSLYLIFYITGRV